MITLQRKEWILQEKLSENGKWKWVSEGISKSSPYMQVKNFWMRRQKNTKGAKKRFNVEKRACRS